MAAGQQGYEDVRIDDDNFPTGDDFLGAHAVAGEQAAVATVAASNGWFNVCETLEDKNGARFYPRGYPYAQR